MEYKVIREKIYSYRDELVEKLSMLVRVPSIQSEAKPRAPFGESCAKVLEVAEEMFRAEGLSTELHAESGYLLAKTAGEGNRLGLYGHADVVPVGTGWTLTEPFEPKIIDGFIVGRGAYDNKSGVVESLFALRALRELGIAPKHRVTVYVGSNEESGMADIRNYVKEQEMPEVNLVPDCSYPAGRGEKGILRFYAVGREKLRDVVGFSGGEAFNIILGEAGAEISCAGTDFAGSGGITAEYSYGILKLRAKGFSKHAADPEGSRNAGKLLADAIFSGVSVCEGDREIMKNISSMLDGYYGEGLGIVNSDPDFGKLTCSNGIVGLRDGHPIVSFDVRYGPSVGGDELESRITARLDELGFDFELQSNRPGFVIDPNDRWLKTVVDAYHDCSGESESEPVLNGGGTYARYLKNGISVGCACHRPRPFALPDGHGGCHQPDETVSVDGILDAAAILAYMIMKVDAAE